MQPVWHQNRLTVEPAKSLPMKINMAPCDCNIVRMYNLKVQPRIYLASSIANVQVTRRPTKKQNLPLLLCGGYPCCKRSAMAAR